MGTAKKESNQPIRKEVNPMTVKEYTDWYRENYNIDPPIKFLKYCVDYEDDLEDWLS
jgi:hypothetical protein